MCMSGIQKVCFKLCSLKLTDQLSEATVTQKVVKNAGSDDYRRLKAENAALKKSLESKFCKINSLNWICKHFYCL